MLQRTIGWTAILALGVLAAATSADSDSESPREGLPSVGSHLDAWAEASKEARPMTGAERRRLVTAWRSRLGGHEIDVLELLEGRVTRRQLDERFDWRCASGSDGAFQLSGVPRDAVERLFISRIEVSIDPATRRPSTVRFFTRGGEMRPVVALERPIDDRLGESLSARVNAAYDEDPHAAIQTVEGTSDDAEITPVRPAVAESVRTPPRRLDPAPARKLKAPQNQADPEETGWTAEHLLTVWQKASAHIRTFRARCIVVGPDPFSTRIGAEGELAFGPFPAADLPPGMDWARQWLGPIHAETVRRRYDATVERADDELILVTLAAHSPEGRSSETLLVTLSTRTMLPVQIARHDRSTDQRMLLTLVETWINGPLAPPSVDGDSAARRTVPVVSPPAEDQNGARRGPNPPIESRGVDEND